MVSATVPNAAATVATRAGSGSESSRARSMTSAQQAAGPEPAQHGGVERLVGYDGEAGQGALSAVAFEVAQQRLVAALVRGEHRRRDRQLARLARLDVAQLDVAVQRRRQLLRRADL